jgi:hypothetical protein
MGGGDDREIANPSSRRRSERIHRRLLALRDAYFPELAGQPPTAEWVGPMGFTPDQLPAIGALRPGVIVAAGFNGYGGTYCTAAGEAAALMALTDEVPEWVPEDVFSPRRLLSDEPLFMGAHDSLWRIAASLCRQLRTVDGQICELLGFASEVPSRSAGHVSRRFCSDTDVQPETLRRLPSFRGFSPEEARELLALLRCWYAPQGSLLFEEGSSGDTCLILARGSVDVSVQVRGGRHRLARLAPGSIFGQVSLIDGEPRSASCAAHSDTLLLELGRDACESLMRSRSPTALKFLGALNQGLIAALRGADRKLMQLTGPNAQVDEQSPSKPSWPFVVT